MDNNFNINNNTPFGADVPNGDKEHKENITADSGNAYNKANAQPQQNNAVTPPAFSIPQWGNQTPVNSVPVPPMPPAFTLPQWNNQAPVNGVPAPPVPPMPQESNPTQLNSSQTDVKNDTDTNQPFTTNESVANQQNTTVADNAYQQQLQYQQIYNQDYNQTTLPQIEYVPYIPGTPLPKGVTPQFINGGWYYPVTVKGKKSKRKKMKTSVKVFLGVMAGVAVISVALLVGWLSNFENTGGGLGDVFGFESSAEESKEDNQTQVGLLANPNGPEIKVDCNYTLAGSTEIAYEVLSECVVSIAVYI